MADRYRVLEELGSQCYCPGFVKSEADRKVIGGSFGVVYKGIEKDTGDVVAIKHVRHILCYEDCIDPWPSDRS